MEWDKGIMVTLYYIATCILGFLLGAIYNVIGHRIPKGEPIIQPLSHYLNCAREVPIIAVLTAILFTVSPWLVGWSKELLIAWALASLLMIIFVTDIYYMIIPDKVLLFFTGLFIILRVIVPLEPWWDMIAGSLIGFTLLLLIAIVSRGGMGGGDIKLFAVLGLVLGWKGILLAFFVSTLIGAIIGGIGIVLGKVKRGKAIPFGPAIAIGALTVYFYGERIIEWYTQSH